MNNIRILSFLKSCFLQLFFICLATFTNAQINDDGVRVTLNRIKDSIPNFNAYILSSTKDTIKAENDSSVIQKTTRFFKSHNNYYFLLSVEKNILSYLNSTIPPDLNPEISISFFDKEGKCYWTMKNDKIINSCIISNTGLLSIIWYQPWEDISTLNAYDKNGSEIISIEDINHIIPSQTGEVLYLFQQTERIPKATYKMIRYDIHKNEIVNLKYYGENNLKAISGNGEFLIYADSSATYCLDKNLKTMWVNKTLKNIKHLSYDGKYLLCLDDEIKNIRIYNNKELKEVASFSLPSAGKSLIPYYTIINPDNSVISILYWKNDNDQLFQVINFYGKVLFSYTFTDMDRITGYQILDGSNGNYRYLFTFHNKPSLIKPINY